MATSALEFGVALPQFGRFASPETIGRLARAAEDLGWSSVWAADHIVVPHPYLDRFSETIFEVFTTLMFAAARTRRVRIGTSVLLLAYRHPVMIAKQVASLDHFAGGRTILGIAPGWMREEFEILGLPFEDRGPRADEALRALKVLWTSDNPRFEGRYYRFGDFAFAPRPLQQPHPPLWVGGNNRRALRRAAGLGDGWHPISSMRIGLTLEELRAGIKELHAMAAANDRDPAALTVALRAPLAFQGTPTTHTGHLTFAGSADQILERLAACAAVGVRHIVFDLFYSLAGQVETGSVAEFVETMERFTREIQPRL